jgi:U3 small nucleolar RNA-associated protein 12
VQLSADDALIMTTSEGQIKIWNVSTKNCIRTMATGYALCGVFVPGGRHVIVGLKSGK